MPFIIGFSTITLAALFCRYGRYTERNKKFFLVLSFLILFVLMGLRSPNLGTDSLAYNNIFIRVGQQSSFQNALSVSGISAPGYILFCRIIFRLFPFNQARIVATTIVILLGIYRYVCKMSNNIYLSILLYISLTFYVQGFNISRQYMAMAFLLNAFAEWYIDKKSIKGWVLFVIAMSFHTTAIVGLAAWLLIGNNIDYNDKKQIRKLVLKSLCLSAFIILAQTQLINVFIRFFPIYRNYFGNRALNQFSDQGQGRTIVIIFGYFAIALYCLFLLRKRIAKPGERLLAAEQLPLMLFSVIIGILGASYPAILRMNIFLTITAITFIPNTFSIDKPSNRRLLTIFTLLLTFAFLTIYMYEDKSDVLPYSFYWASQNLY